MKKIIIPILLFAFALPVLGLTLYDYYIQTEGYFPSVNERAKEYNIYFSDKYRGTYEQNVKFLDKLTDEESAIGGFTSRGYPTNFLTVSTSGPISIGSDAQ